MCTSDKIVRIAFAAGLSAFATPAFADIVISSGATNNVTCSSGVCTPTSSNAVLNVGDLETLLGGGNVTLAAAAEPVDVDVAASLSWVSTSTLTIDSHHSVNVDQPVAVTGGGGLSVITNDGGTGGYFTFAPGASVAIWSLSSNLAINSTPYTLVANLATLASDIAANPSGSYALVGNYNATPDGTYSSSPVSTNFFGNFQGLGNTISDLAISSKASHANIGLFAEAESGSTISNVVMTDSKVVAKGMSSSAGILVATDHGTLFGDHTSGTVSVGKSSYAGGLAAGGATVIASSSSASVSAKDASGAGGLLWGGNTIAECFASGNVKLSGIKQGSAGGGLLGAGALSVSNSYATGSVEASGSSTSNIGGLVGSVSDGPTFGTSYSTGKVSGAAKYIGGFFGFYQSGTETNSYWDTQTSGTNNASGDDHTLPGVTGVTTKQLKSSLPAGFDPTIWAQSKTINEGFPYLIANPPQ
jgi:hypothetical protein